MQHGNYLRPRKSAKAN